MRANEFITEAELDPTGWGSTPYGTDIDYFGLRVQMKPSTFLKLALPLSGGAINPEVEKHMKAGGKIAYPMLDIQIPPEWDDGNYKKSARVVSHEGRNRMTNWIKLKGDEPVQVNLVPRGGLRRRDFKPEWIKELSNGLFSEGGNYISQPFDISTALEEDMSRRGFLGALGAMAATGAQAATGLKAPKDFTVLSNNTNNEIDQGS